MTPAFLSKAGMGSQSHIRLFGIRVFIVFHMGASSTLYSKEGRSDLMRKDLGRSDAEPTEEFSALKDARQKIAKLEAEVADLKRVLVESDSPAVANVVNANGVVVGPSGKRYRRNIADRVDYLERKLSGLTNWLPDPQLWRRTQYECKNRTDWETQDDMQVCLDGWERRAQNRHDRPCVVYDLGIRAQPAFGLLAAKNFHCNVRAYDPSPTTAAWWDSNETEDVNELKQMGESRYKLWKYAAGGSDGKLELFTYAWQQVSIFKEEADLTRPDVIAKQHPGTQESIYVPAKTLPTMLADNGDSFIDVLKIDIEGSEYMFFQDVFDRMGCPPVQQLTVEYHHFSIDERYGSSPEINTIHKLLNDCGFRSFYVRDHWRNALAHPDDKFYLSPKRYTFAGYCRDCGNEADA